MKHFKGIMVIMVVLAVFSTGTALALDSVVPSINTSKELLANGGLEAVTGGVPDGIGLYVGGTTTATWAETLVTDSAAAHSGNNYFSSNNKANVGMVFNVNNLTEGKVYELSFWYKASAANAASYYVRYLKDDVIILESGYDILRDLGSTGGAWRHMLVRFKLDNSNDAAITGENGVKIELVSNMYGADAGVAFDDVSLVAGNDGTYILNGDMESVINTITDWNYSGTVTADTEMVHGGTYSMKLTSAGGTSYATQGFLLESNSDKYEVTAYVNIPQLDEGSMFLLSVNSGYETGTELSSKLQLTTTTGGWEKISYVQEGIYQPWIRFSIIGTGTAYLDDVKVEKPFVINGGLDGFSSDTMLRNVTYSPEVSLSNVHFSYTTEQKYEGEGSMKFSPTTAASDYFKMTGQGLEANKVYLLTFQYKAVDGGAPVVHVMNTGLNQYFNTDSNRWLSSPPSSEWTFYTVPFIPTTSTFAIRFYCSSGGKTVYFDDVKVQKAVDAFGFYDGANKIETVTPALQGKTISAKWSYVYNDRTLTPVLVAAVYELTDSGAKVLVSIDVDTAQAFNENRPIQTLEGTIQVPNVNGEYVLEAMFWKDLNSLQPMYTKEVIN